MDKSEYLRLNGNQSGLLAKFKSLLDSGLDWYSSEALQLFELKRFPSRKDDQLIQQILSKSPNDEKKKTKGKDYYFSNALTFIKVLKNLLSIDFIQRFESQEIDDLTIYNYHRVIRNLLFDSLVGTGVVQWERFKSIQPLKLIGF